MKKIHAKNETMKNPYKNGVYYNLQGFRWVEYIDGVLITVEMTLTFDWWLRRASANSRQWFQSMILLQGRTNPSFIFKWAYNWFFVIGTSG